MELEKLKEYYALIDKCSIKLDTSNLNFDYIQTQIGKSSVHTEELNRMIGEILVSQTELEHRITDAKFEYELKFVQYSTTHTEVQRLATGKERQQYINYVLMKDEFKNLTNLEQELKDTASLLEFANKKAKDLDRTYPKLKTLWDSVQSELKSIKNIGSDEQYISKVRDSISEDQSHRKPLFLDTSVEQLKDYPYNKEAPEEVASSNKDIQYEVDDLLADL